MHVYLLIGTGFVVDRISKWWAAAFLDTPFRFAVFDVADVSISLGLFLGLVGVYLQGDV